MTDADDRYLRLPELVAYSTFSERQLRRFSQDPTHPLPLIRVGGRVVCKRSAFDTWLREHEAPTAARSVSRAHRLMLAARGNR